MQVRFANTVGLPFLAVNSAHGSTDTLARVQNGIEIYIRTLNSITINPDGNSAVIGGGAYTQSLLDYLESYGKVAGTPPPPQIYSQRTHIPH
jgi:FAD/FMN-containing dehydrogenase